MFREVKLTPDIMLSTITVYFKNTTSIATNRNNAFDYEWSSCVKAIIVFFQESLFGERMKIAIVLTRRTLVAEMMFIYLSKNWTHFQLAARTDKMSLPAIHGSFYILDMDEGFILSPYCRFILRHLQ
jgi:hypothetical protein